LKSLAPKKLIVGDALTTVLYDAGGDVRQFLAVSFCFRLLVRTFPAKGEDQPSRHHEGAPRRVSFASKSKKTERESDHRGHAASQLGDSDRFWRQFLSLQFGY
jgi:hypothetical protein